MKTFPCNRQTIVGERWGDESETFLSSIDVLLRFGGGPQSQAEFGKFAGSKVWFDVSSFTPEVPIQIIERK